MGWFWYLSCDMQLFVFAPIVMTVRFVPATRGLAFYALLLGGVATAVYGAVKYQPFMNGRYYQITPWRMGPYLLGVLFASLLRHDATRRMLKMPLLRAAMYVVSLGLLVSCINLMWLMQAQNIKARTRTARRCASGSSCRATCRSRGGPAGGS